MKLIIGGAFQGKLEFAKTTYGITDGWVDGRTCDFDKITDCRGIHHFHDYLRRLLNTGGPAELSELEDWASLFADQVYQDNPNLCIVSNELGYGIVPMEKDDRIWREAAGRVCTRLAEDADEVVRVVCGLGIWLKKDIPAHRVEP